MNLNDLASYVRVAELGTITAAASAEGVPKSTITRRIARLEEQLGVELLRRSARSFAVTDDGRLLQRLAAGALRELRDAEQALAARTETPQGRLVVSAPDFGRSEPFAELMVAYRARFPLVEVELRLENRVVDLVYEGVDVGLRAHTKQIPGAADLMARDYALPAVRFYASPAYLARRGAPATPAALAEHDLVLHSAGVGYPKALSSPSGQVTVDLGAPAFQANDTLAVRALVEASAGVGMLPAFVAARAVEGGRLAPVLPEWALRAGRIAVVWPASRHLAPRVRAFVDLAHALFSGGGLGDADPAPPR